LYNPYVYWPLALLLLLLQVRFSGDQGSITAMMSAEGEVVDLAAPVKVGEAHVHTKGCTIPAAWRLLVPVHVACFINHSCMV
jgi:hypothetical protein